MIPLQLLSLLFGLFMIYWSFFIYKKKVVNLTELIFWAITWSIFILIALFPITTKFFLETFRINRTMDLVMILAFMVLWITSYANYLENKKLKKKLQDLVREIAIKERNKKKKL